MAAAFVLLPHAMAQEPMPRGVDHLVYATPDLEQGIAEIESLLGVTPVIGGRHPAFGTRNALLSIGPGTYFEIIAPDPENPVEGPMIFGLDRVRESRLVTWVLRAEDIDELVIFARAGGLELGEAQAGSRSKPDGTVVAWKATDPFAWHYDGLIPFVIAWGESQHPSTVTPPAGTLTKLRFEYPDPKSVEKAFEILGVELDVTEGAEPALIATIETPGGTVEIR